jgi:hypothetical protein
MAYTNHLLFNNVFLNNLAFNAEELAEARHLVHSSAKDWYSHADFSSPASIARTWIQPLLNQRDLDLVQLDGQDAAWFFVAPWERENPLALCLVVDHDTNLDGIDSDGRLPKGQHWMIEAVNLAANQLAGGLRWVVLTNGVQWRLLDSRSLRRYEAYLEIDLFKLLQGEDDDRAAYLFYRLLRLEDSLERDPDTGENRLGTFLQESVNATEQIESYLKTTVSDNLNTPGGGDGIMAQLCLGLVRAIDPTGTKAFTEQERAAIYRDATYLLYRLLFILYAEARNLLPMDRADYRDVSLSRLIDEARDLRDNPARLQPGSVRLWEQLAWLFNAIEFSDEYLGIPPYNGGLFESKDKPYLSQLKIEDIYLAEALFELAFFLEPDKDALPEQIDYRDLSVRHLGSLYEGMIEYRLFIAEERLLARRDKKGKVKYLSAAKESRKPNDEELEPGKVYFAQSPHERKATGTHYTAEDLVERLTRQTVLRLLDERWAAFSPQLAHWLDELDQTTEPERLQHFIDSQLEAFVREQVLSLRICDPAMGSGHFLVHIAHTITNFILRTLSRTPWANPAVNLHPDEWRRLVAENCLYGVDVNQMASELAKLSLWLATMQVGQPLSFLDHHLKYGNSLLGVRLEEILAILAYDDLTKNTAKSRVAEDQGQYTFKTLPQAVRTIEKANEWLAKVTTQVVNRVEDIHQQEYDYEEAQRLLEPYKQIGDLLVAHKMGLKAKDSELAVIARAIESDLLDALSNDQRSFIEETHKILGERLSLHWELEFSSVFSANGAQGFDVIIGNPPFLGGYKIRGELGVEFSEYLRKSFVNAKGQADLCVYFFRQGYSLIIEEGYLGMVATNTIGQGDSRLAGLAFILQNNGVITCADRYVKWLGDASVEVNLVSIVKQHSNSSNKHRLLDGFSVPEISSWLDDLPEIEPKPLAQNKSKAFIGDALRGMGFILDLKEAHELLQNPKNVECVLPYLVGEELNDHPEQKPGRFVICFKDWELSKAKEYPELLNILEKRVKPERDKVREKGDRENWWRFARYRKELRNSISHLDKVWVRSSISEYHALALVPTNQVNSKQLVIFAFDDFYSFSVLQSCAHDSGWLRRQASTLETRTSYTNANCFDPFPFPQAASKESDTQAKQLGKIYYERRQQLMHLRQLGLTKLYNLFNDPACQDEDIVEMRRLHAAMDESVLACYGWQDIALEHDFYPNDRKKIRFVPSAAAQRELFIRLIELNQEIAAQESAQELE